MFNDSISLISTDTNTTICNGSFPQTSSCSKTGIAWYSDVQYKFKFPYQGNRVNPQEYYNESGHQVPLTNDTDLIVWMRTAALPNFRKLYRVISTPLNQGDYQFLIIQNYPVIQFGGSKAAILSTSSWIGGKNLFLGICYLVVGGLCLLLAFGFLIATFIYRLRSKKN